MKIVRYLTVAFFALLLVACGPKPLKTDASNTSSIIANISYGKDYRTGLCFGVTTYPGYGSEYISITNVPCDMVQEQLKEK